MSFLHIRNSEDDGDTVILFPITSEEGLTLVDLRSAFPTLSSLRYKDGSESQFHHILCRDGIFVPPHDGWDKEGRVYTAISGTDPKGNSRFGIFDSYRRRLSSRGRNSDTTIQNQRRTTGSRVTEMPNTTIKIGHGHFKSGKFTKISAHSLSGLGGIVTVGPFLKTGNTANEIQAAAFSKFCTLNRGFRRKYRKREDRLLLVYPDGSVVETLPDKSEDFSLQGYRNFLDPTQRYDRIRLFLCDKENYDHYHKEVEVVTDSSSEDELPEISIHTTRPTATKNAASPSDKDDEKDDTLPLVIAVDIKYGERVINQNFPNNTNASVLFAHVYEKVNKRVMLRVGDKYVKPDDRLMELTSNASLLLYAEDHESVEAENGEDDGENSEIDGEFEGCSSVADYIAARVAYKTANTEEPTGILKEYAQCFTSQPAEEEEEERQTTRLYVGRGNLWDNAIDEILTATNLRNVVEVIFYGELCEDLGGPRLEFFRLFINEARERLLDEENHLRYNREMVISKSYYGAGVLIGLSAIQGGPCAPFLADVIDGLLTEEHHNQFKQGLERVGVFQLINLKPSVAYLFRRHTNKLTVNRLLHLLQPELSETGTNKRMQEDASYTMFIRYVRRVAAGRREGITLGSILQFVTGADEEPVLGFVKMPTMKFTDLPGSLPTASTCSLELYLPTNLQPDADQFEKLDLAFANTYFGLV